LSKLSKTVNLYYKTEMDTKEIQRLLDYIAKSPLAEVSIETEGLKVSVKKIVQ